MIPIEKAKEAARQALEKECTNCDIAFTAEDTNADLCVKLNNH